jgi:hypothetical protein
MKKTICLLMALFIFAALVFSGCGKSTPTPTELTPAEIINRSGEKMQALNSFHFVLDQGGKGSPLAMGVEMIKAEGDVVRPDKLQMTISGTAMGMSLEVKMVTVGEKTLMTNPLSSKWEVPPAQFQVLNVFDPGTGIASIMKGITIPAKLADEEMGGALCYHLTGSTTSDALRPITGSAVEGATIKAESWIGKEDFLVRHIKLEGKITESEKEGIVRTIDLSRLNQPISITLPE